jgi:hypothetical protein
MTYVRLCEKSVHGSTGLTTNEMSDITNQAVRGFVEGS